MGITVLSSWGLIANREEHGEYMCKAFSCIVGSDKKVTWKLGVDSHTDLLKLTDYKDNTADPRQMEFARVEITPENGDYLNPDKWTFRVDERIRPAWWSRDYEAVAHVAHQQWLQELERVLIRKPIVHPFRVPPPKEITQEHIDLVKQWASVGASVRASVGDSVRASVWASIGIFFRIAELEKCSPVVRLWEMGLVPSYDGKVWRLHGGPEGKVLWGERSTGK